MCVIIYPLNECGRQALGNRSGNYLPDIGATRITCGRLLIDAEDGNLVLDARHLVLRHKRMFACAVESAPQMFPGH